MSSSEPRRINRREAIKWMLAAVAIVPALDSRGLGGTAPNHSGLGTDPDLLRGEVPWDLTFTEEQRKTCASLCDVVLPADERSPAASEVGLPDFIDEWISAPYPAQQNDRTRILDGLAWINDESEKRFQKKFTDLEEAQKEAIVDDIYSAREAQEEFMTAAHFFTTFRNLTVGGFYTTREGMQDIQYIGNVPLVSFDGPPPEVLAHLKLD